MSGTTSTWRTSPSCRMYFAKDRGPWWCAAICSSRWSTDIPAAARRKAARWSCAACARSAARPCTGAIRSEADTLPKIIEEMIGVPPLGARKPRHRSRPGRLHGDQETRGILLMAQPLRTAQPGRKPAGRFAARTRRTSSVSPPPAAWTMASQRSSGGCFTIRKGVYEDQLALMCAKPRRNQTTGGMDLSLLTDGLRAEREQGITIDVAYRYFATPRRKFIIADTPGHEQYTRNMATGASTANLAIVLIDARHGVLPQSRRHAFIAALLGIPHIVVAGQQNGPGGFPRRRLRSPSARNSPPSPRSWQLPRPAFHSHQRAGWR